MSEEEKPTIKRTVTIWGGNNVYIRKVWAELVRQGYKASYSKALNVLIYIGIMSIQILNKLPLEDEEKLAQTVVNVYKDMFDELGD